ncbi:MAG: ABC transporter ATP-binding protein [Nevskiaceae bacterium]|nr:MAG: ABC transporter ATP-binding protein [Nevskiaceae bacterium]TAM23067.1 MAG: ABC transporter ATP-binding protein [Nevskiaceae bacterium]
MALLEVDGLSIDYPRGRVVDGLSFTLEAGACLGLVGESGSGKSQSALALLGLLPAQAKVQGALRFQGRDLLTLEESARRRLRGSAIGMVFQDPMSSLNPYLRIGSQLTEMLVVHRGLGRGSAEAEALRMLEAVRIGDAYRRLRQYPHEFSGGMRQRVMIAMMLLLKPALLIADEPTTALDVTVQAEVLRLLAELRREFGLALLMISHDLGVIAEVADEVLVLYGGRMMERGPVPLVLGRPQHPYTQGLIACRPRLDSPLGQPLPAIPGTVASAREAGAGCGFAPRCRLAREICRQQTPAWTPLGAARYAACHGLAGAPEFDDG